MHTPGQRQTTSTHNAPAAGVNKTTKRGGKKGYFEYIGKRSASMLDAILFSYAELVVLAASHGMTAMDGTRWLLLSLQVETISCRHQRSAMLPQHRNKCSSKAFGGVVVVHYYYLLLLLLLLLITTRSTTIIAI